VSTAKLVNDTVLIRLVIAMRRAIASHNAHKCLVKHKFKSLRAQVKSVCDQMLVQLTLRSHRGIPLLNSALSAMKLLDVSWVRSVIQLDCVNFVILVVHAISMITAFPSSVGKHLVHQVLVFVAVKHAKLIVKNVPQLLVSARLALVKFVVNHHKWLLVFR